MNAEIAVPRARLSHDPSTETQISTPLPLGFMVRPFAHRGLHDRSAGRVENSLDAFDAAVAAGYAIELDVQLSGDGHAVVFHDRTLDRLTAETGPVSARPLSALERIQLAGTGGGIPSLRAALARIGGRVPVVIELKDQTKVLGESDGRLEAAVARELERYRGAAAVMSFNPSMIATLSRLLPEVPRGLTTDAFAVEAWPHVPPERLAELRQIDLEAVHGVFVSHDRRDLDAPRLADLRRRGAAILSWTIRLPEEEAAALRRADAITFEGYRPGIPANAA